MAVLFTNGIIHELLKSLFYRLVLLRTNEDKNGGDTWTHAHQFLQNSFAYETRCTGHQDSSIGVESFNRIRLIQFFIDIVLINFYVHCIYVIRSSAATTVIVQKKVVHTMINTRRILQDINIILEIYCNRV